MAGNAATSLVATGPAVQRAPLSVQADEAPTPAYIGGALGEIRTESTRTRKVGSLRPWVIFETLPWNPSDGRKKRLFAALKKAWAALHRAEKTLAEAKKREAAGPGRSRPGRSRRKARLPSAAEAQSAVDKAMTTINARTDELKQYVKSMLGSSRNPRTTAARAERKAAETELGQLQRDLRSASRRRRPDAAQIASLTERQNAARVRLDAAKAALKALLATLGAEIDAADWSEQEVDRSTTVLLVGGARVTLENKTEAYATVTGEGFEGSAEQIKAGGPSVPDLLAKDATLGPSTRKILAIISRFEGGFSALNTWDIADVTFGMVQWTTGQSGRGDLIRALTIVKQAAPEAFADRLTRYGVDVDPEAGFVVTRPDGRVLRGVAAAKFIQSDSQLAAVLSAAGTDPAIQAAELRAANEIEVAGALHARLSLHVPAKAAGEKARSGTAPVSSFITSELGVGILSNHTVHGGFPKAELQRAVNAYIAAHAVDPKADLSDWAPDAEQTLTDAISKGIDADRVAAMKKELDAGRGSFK